MASGRKQILMAAFLGSVLVNIPSLFQSHGVNAMWCWKADGTSASTLFNCNSASAIGSGACVAAETCCDGYVCYQAGECANRVSSSSAVPNGEESATRMLGLASGGCGATSGGGMNGTNGTSGMMGSNTSSGTGGTGGTGGTSGGGATGNTTNVTLNTTVGPTKASSSDAGKTTLAMAVFAGVAMVL